jgi:hypothetical protein
MYEYGTLKPVKVILRRGGKCHSEPLPAPYNYFIQIKIFFKKKIKIQGFIVFRELPISILFKMGEEDPLYWMVICEK